MTRRYDVSADDSAAAVDALLFMLMLILEIAIVDFILEHVN